MTEQEHTNKEMDFGDALRALKEGRAVRRSVWGGDSILILVPGSTFEITANRPMGKALPHKVGQNVSYQTHIDWQYTCGTRGPVCEVWLAGPEDLLAEDWELVDPSKLNGPEWP